MRLRLGRLTVYVGSPWQVFVSRVPGEYTALRVGPVHVEWREW